MCEREGSRACGAKITTISYLLDRRWREEVLRSLQQKTSHVNSRNMPTPNVCSPRRGTPARKQLSTARMRTACRTTAQNTNTNTNKQRTCSSRPENSKRNERRFSAFHKDGCMQTSPVDGLRSGFLAAMRDTKSCVSGTWASSERWLLHVYANNANEAGRGAIDQRGVRRLRQQQRLYFQNSFQLRMGMVYGGFSQTIRTRPLEFRARRKG